MRRSNAAAAKKGTKGSRAPKEERKRSELKIPLPDPVTEQVIIAAALVDHVVRGKLCSALSVDYFFADGHAEAWALIEELERRGLSFDPATAKQLGEGKLDPAYLEELIEQRPKVPPNLQHHLDLLRWDRTRIDAIRGPVGSFVEALANAKSDPDDVLRLARTCVESLDGHGSLKYLRDPNKLVVEQMAELERRREGDACYPFGLQGFDMYSDGPLAGQWRILPGAAPGDVTVITGLPGSGKTTFTARLVVEQVNQQRRVLCGAWEQGSGLTLELCASISLGISRTALTTGQYDDDTLDAMRLEMERLSQYLRFVELPFDRGRGEEGHTREVNNRHLDTIYEYIVATAPDCAVFDLWNRALVSANPDEESQMLYRQQAMLQATKCHGLLVHQLNEKDVYAKTDKTPGPSDLKGSGAWIAVPSMIIGIHREFLFKDVPDDTLKAVILKQRKGVFPLAVEFPWNADTGYIGEGRCATYVKPGTRGAVDSFIDGELTPAQIAKTKESKKRERRMRLG